MQCSYLCVLFLYVDMHKETQAMIVSRDDFQYCYLNDNCKNYACRSDACPYCVHGICNCIDTIHHQPTHLQMENAKHCYGGND
jgi:hypothetical protein